MLKSVLSVLLLIAASSVPSYAACSKPVYSQAENRTIDPKRFNDAAMDAAVLKAVNYQRCRAGRGALRSDSGLRAMAVMHSTAMARHDFFSHTSGVRGQKRLKDRAKAANVRYRALGENIASQPRFRLVGRTFMKQGACAFVYADTREVVPAHSYASLANAVVAGWMESDGHRDNILSKKFNRTSAVARLNAHKPLCGQYVVTQVFAD